MFFFLQGTDWVACTATTTKLRRSCGGTSAYPSFQSMKSCLRCAGSRKRYTVRYRRGPTANWCWIFTTTIWKNSGFWKFVLNGFLFSAASTEPITVQSHFTGLWGECFRIGPGFSPGSKICTLWSSRRRKVTRQQSTRTNKSELISQTTEKITKSNALS